MCEVLSDVHVFTKFNLLPEKSIAISRFQFYLPNHEKLISSNVYDQEDPPKKKHKVSSPEGHQTRGPFYQVIDVSVGSNTCSSVRVDTDGDLILERCSRGCESSDDEVEHNIQKADQMSNKYKDDLTRSDKDQELYVITLRHSLATQLNEVGEQVWLGALLLSDYIIYKSIEFRDKTVVDLGSGTGLTSIVAAMFANSVYCTDVGQKILDIAKYNVDSQMLFPKHPPCSIHVKELDWFKPVAVSEGDNPYGLVSEDVTGIYNAQIIIAADVVYDNDITDAFIQTVMELMSEPPNKRLLIGLEKRLVFTIEDLDIASPAYNHFRRKLKHFKSTSLREKVTYRVEQVQTDFPQYFKYKRSKQLELWLVEAMFAGT